MVWPLKKLIFLFACPCITWGVVKDCIRSIVAQPFGDLSYEILCLDDCSTDNSFQLLQQLAQEYPQVKALQNESNGGVCFTCNRMMELAKGEYIWFIDPDDMLAQNAVQYVTLARENHADIFLGNYVRVPENMTLDENTYYCETENKELKHYTDFFPRDNTGETLASVCCAFVADARNVLHIQRHLPRKGFVQKTESAIMKYKGKSVLDKPKRFFF